VELVVKAVKHLSVICINGQFLLCDQGGQISEIIVCTNKAGGAAACGEGE
jgi:hypothetical protein